MSVLNKCFAPEVRAMLPESAESRVRLLTDKQTRRLMLQTYEATQNLFSLGSAAHYTVLIEEAMAHLFTAEVEHGNIKKEMINKLGLFLLIIENVNDCVLNKLEKNLKKQSLW